MKRISVILSGLGLFSLVSCAQQNNPSSSISTINTSLSFPGAEGFGKYTTGGRGGKVYIVSNLNDDGEGSLRKAATVKGPRIIVFAVSGTIHLLSPLAIKADATIAGQTAPGDGICIADYPVGLSGNNIIIRYLRFRMGDKNQNKGMVHGSGHDDALSASRRNNIIIDHCSISWSTDECFSVYGGDSTTLQWNLISEPLNYSYHFEEGDKDFENHGYGGIWGGSHLSAHHNLFAHCVSRNPRFNGTRLGATQEFVDFRNNVIYNWGGNSTYGGEAGNYNMINNYYKYGPSTNKNVKFRIVNPTKTDVLNFGKFYVNGNYVDGAKDVTKNNWLGIDMGNNGTLDDKKEAVMDKPFSAESIPEYSAAEAYEAVLKFVGASHKRDTLDERIISDVKNRTGGFIDVQGGFPHGTAYEQTIAAWPVLKTLPTPTDTDKDGMPDDWEKRNGLNPIDPSDASQNKLDKHYTNVEVYINSIVK
ncbi:MAG: pectate lyase [Chitinophagaceae bacterium]|nr:pectate lyase [Chitinophagaceae bacterium]